MLVFLFANLISHTVDYKQNMITIYISLNTHVIDAYESPYFSTIHIIVVAWYCGNIVISYVSFRRVANMYYTYSYHFHVHPHTLTDANWCSFRNKGDWLLHYDTHSIQPFDVTDTILPCTSWLRLHYCELYHRREKVNNYLQCLYQTFMA